MHRSVWLLCLILECLLFGCGGTSKVVPTPPKPRPTVDEKPKALLLPQKVSPRALGATSTFRDLVNAAQALDDTQKSDSSAGCLLRGPGQGIGGFRLEADVAIAVRPLPDATASLNQLLSQYQGAAQVLTRWGARGTEKDWILAAFTSSPPTRGDALVIALADEGVFMRRTEASIKETFAGPFPSSELPKLFAQVSGVSEVFVTAAASVPVREVFAAVSDLSTELPITLAVMLPSGVVPPASATAKTAPLCDALASLSGDEGSIDEQALARAIALPNEGNSFVEKANTCLSSARGAGASGTRMRIAFRIAPSGGVKEVCVMADSAGDPDLRSCVEQALKSVALPKPTGGSVDIEVPLLLSPTSSQQKAICDDAR